MNTVVYSVCSDNLFASLQNFFCGRFLLALEVPGQKSSVSALPQLYT